MFKEWGFLLTEIWVLLALMALIGLFAGWLIWGGSADCSDCEAKLAEKEDELRRLRSVNHEEVRRLQADLEAERAREAVVAPAPVSAPAPSPEPVVEDVVEVDVVEEMPEAVEETPSVGVKPEGLEAARNGIPDDLKLIKGVGPKMEKLCNSLGYYHFDQIAAWTPDEVAWVDDNLEGFKGRVTRDNWVAQAKDLAK